MEYKTLNLNLNYNGKFKAIEKTKYLRDYEQ
jgi:hypothetical protein